MKTSFLCNSKRERVKNMQVVLKKVPNIFQKALLFYKEVIEIKFYSKKGTKTRFLLSRIRFWRFINDVY